MILMIYVIYFQIPNKDNECIILFFAQIMTETIKIELIFYLFDSFISFFLLEAHLCLCVWYILLKSVSISFITYIQEY